MRLLGLGIIVCAVAASAETPRVALAKGFTPNPLLVSVPRDELQPLDGFVTCKDAPAGARVTKSAALVLNVAEGIARLNLTASNGDRVVARGADGSLRCGERSLVVDVKPGALEVFVVTAAPEGPGRVRVFDADRPRILPDAVKTVRLPVTLEGEVGDGMTPDAQLEVTADVKGVKWKLTGAADEVWLSSLELENNQPAVRAGEVLKAGRYAVWIRGWAKGAYQVTASTGAAAAEPVVAQSDDALVPVTKPAADAPVEQRALAGHLPALNVESLKGWSRQAQSLRKRAFTELPGEFFVFAAADGEVLLPLAVEADGELSVIAADGATFSMRASELSVSPKAVLIRPARSELVEKLTLADLVDAADPRMKKLEKLTKKIRGCVERHPDWPDAEKRCNVNKIDQARAKLEAELKKAYAKQQAAELVAVEKHVKAVVVARAN